ncbi:MAG: 16S rRNA (uracil(1498)-N(3))-methyltransferase [Eubacterium sp.]|nr:16S rRNA (uracil(1498)-N(3))-methyltransferase [Eubacterium sp.]
MHRFFVDDIHEAEKRIMITGPDVNHIRSVLRLRPGEEIQVSDGSSKDYICSIASVEEDVVYADIIDLLDSNAELPAEINLFQGVPKGDKMETIIQKCVELGVHSIVPVMMERTIVKLDDKKKDKKISRYMGISEAAAKQSRRVIIPEVTDYMGSKEAIDFASKNMDVILFPYELAEGMDESRKVIMDLVSRVNAIGEKSTDNFSEQEKIKIGIFIGPEGGFAESEAELLKAAGAKTISLGHRILRTETAGMAVMSVLSFLLDA